MNDNWISIDVETIWIPELADKRPTDPIELEKCRFDPNFTKLCCIGAYTKKGGGSLLLNKFDFSEGKMLSVFWDHVKNYNLFITFNGLLFDIPMLLRRSWYNNVKSTVDISLARYRLNTNHMDVRAVLGSWGTVPTGNLDLLLQLKFGESHKDKTCGKDVQKLWDEEKYQEVGEYCVKDCKSTYELYESLFGTYLKRNEYDEYNTQEG